MTPEFLKIQILKPILFQNLELHLLLQVTNLVLAQYSDKIRLQKDLFQKPQ